MDIIQSIIELDKAAARRTEDIRKAELQKLDTVDKNAERKQQKLIEKHHGIADSKRAEQEQLLNEKKVDATTALEQSKARIDEVFSSHSEQWQNEIISRITGI
ncbi:MAG: hypothetical protein E7485_07405 [Ruminococcaceae bacterium]|nr:hypothetical protein [Oscillospiraceae bacterium]